MREEYLLPRQQPVELLLAHVGPVQNKSWRLLLNCCGENMSGDLLSCEIHLGPEGRVQTDSMPGLTNPLNVITNGFFGTKGLTIHTWLLLQARRL